MANGMQEFGSARDRPRLIVFTDTPHQSIPKDAIRWRAGSSDHPVIAVIHATGGSGATTLTANATTLLARAPGFRVAAVDLDFSSGTLGAHFGTDIVADGWSRLFDSSSISLQEVLQDLYGVQILPAPTDTASLPVFPEVYAKEITELAENVHCVWLDLPADLHAPQSLGGLACATCGILVFQPDIATVQRVKLWLKEWLSSAFAAMPLHVVINRSGPYSMSAESIQDVLGVSVEAEIPDFAGMQRQALTAGEPLVLLGGEKAASAWMTVLRIPGIAAQLSKAAAGRRESP